MALELHEYLQNTDGLVTDILNAVGLGASIIMQTVFRKTKKAAGGDRRALASHPKVVLADEPTASLDKKSGRDVVEIMQRLAKQGCTILLVTHDNRILDIADRIIHMEDGR